MATAAALAMPEGGAKFTLKPGHVSGSLHRRQFSRRDDFDDGGTIGSIDVTAKGLDTAVASLRRQSDDPAAGKALALLTLVQTFGEQTGDGATHYPIEGRKTARSP